MNPTDTATGTRYRYKYTPQRRSTTNRTTNDDLQPKIRRLVSPIMNNTRRTNGIAHFFPMILQPLLALRVLIELRKQEHNNILWSIYVLIIISVSFYDLQRTNGISIHTNRERQQHQNFFNQPERITMSAEKPSFYKRMLPETCVAFASRRGKHIFASAMANGGLVSFFPLIQQLYVSIS